MCGLEFGDWKTSLTIFVPEALELLVSNFTCCSCYLTFCYLFSIITLDHLVISSLKHSKLRRNTHQSICCYVSLPACAARGRDGAAFAAVSIALLLHVLISVSGAWYDYAPVAVIHSISWSRFCIPEASSLVSAPPSF